jgi:hypothetical protein
MLGGTAASPGEPVVIVSSTSPHWLLIELLDAAGGPVPGASYRVQLVSGEVIEGRLDRQGRVRIEGVDPGSCIVTFPEWDTSAWESA